jgi:putative ABC transport system permease protein
MRWLHRLFQKSRAEQQLDKELRFHLDRQIADYLAAGLSAEEARRRANLDFGGLERVKEEVRDTRWETHLDNLFRDFHYAFRTLRKDRRFASIAILTLALGIGAATVIFSVVDCVLLKPFPYKNVNRLATFHIHFPGRSDENDRSYFGAPEFLDFKEQNHVFDDMIGLAGASVIYTGIEGTERLAAGLITSNAFEILGIKPLLGRPITLDDGKPDSPPVFVMSYPLWVREFNRDPKILGTTFTLSGQPKTLVAIMPPRFKFGGYCEIWIPVTLEKPASAELSLERGPWFWPVGVLKPGVNLQSVAADFDVIARRLAKVYPGGYLREFNVLAETFTDSYVGDVKRLLLTLMAAVAMLLLIACSNVANLLLSRSTVREKEMATRASIGASRSRLIQQLLVESFVLAGAGCVLGCLFTYFGLKAVVAAIPPGAIPSEVVITLSPAALCFALASTLFTTLLCGLAPAIHAARGNLYSRVAGGKGLSGDFRHGTLRACLVIAEVALSLVLLIASGLMMRSMFALEHLKLGFDPANVLFAQLHHPKSYASPEQKASFLRKVLDRVEAIPGVQSATGAITVPPYATGLTDVLVPGREKAESSYAVSELCSEDYLHTLGIPLIRGRFFSKREVDSSQHLVVINQTFARSFFGTEDPIGQKVRFPAWEINYSDWPRGAYFEIIGVVADIKNHSLRDPAMSQIYLPYRISATGLVDDRAIMVKTAGNPDSTLISVRQAIHELDNDVAVTNTGTIEKSLREDFYAGPRFSLITVSTFGGAGLVLVLIGIFSIMAYTVSLRNHEIGVRMALGAQPGDVLRMVLKNGLALIAAGTVIGIITSLALTRFLASQIWGVSATDPWTFAAVAAVVTGTGLAACFLPARRATRIDPLLALRYE